VQKLKIAFVVIFSVLLLSVPVVHSKADHVILSDVLSSSGGEAKSDNYRLETTIGQTVIGVSSSSSYIETAGFCHRGMVPERPNGVKDETHSEPSLPQEYSLFQNFPNPFNPTTVIRYQIPAISTQQSVVSLKIYNILGQRVRTLVNKEQVPGYYSVVWNGRDDYGREMASGVYFYRLEAGSYSSSKKLLLLK